MKRIAWSVMLLVMSVGLIACAAQRAVPAEELLRLGEQYLLELDYEQALAQFLKVVELEPMNPRGYTGAAEAYVGLGDPESAAAILIAGFDRTGDAGLQVLAEQLAAGEGPLDLHWDGQAMLMELYDLFETGGEKQALNRLAELGDGITNFDRHAPAIYTTPEGRGVGIYYTDRYGVYYGEYEGGHRNGEGIWCFATSFDDDYDYRYRFDGIWVNDLPNGYGESVRLYDPVIPDNGLGIMRCSGVLTDGLWDGETWIYFHFFEDGDEFVNGTRFYLDAGYFEVLEVAPAEQGQIRISTMNSYQKNGGDVAIADESYTDISKEDADLARGIESIAGGPLDFHT